MQKRKGKTLAQSGLAASVCIQCVRAKMLVNMHTLNDLQMDVRQNDVNDFIIAKNASGVKAKLRLWLFLNAASTTSVCASSYSPA